MVIEIEERLELKLKCPLGDRDELLEERDDLLATAEVARVVLFAGLVPADLICEE